MEHLFPSLELVNYFYNILRCFCIFQKQTFCTKDYLQPCFENNILLKRLHKRESTETDSWYQAKNSPILVGKIILFPQKKDTRR